MKPLYLDNAATTPIRKEVLDEMISTLKDFGNTESKYYSYAENAKNNVQIARKRIALGLGCEEDEVVFTSGATESNNMFIKGLADANPDKTKIVISSIEHSSIRETCYFLKSKGYNVVEISVDNTGSLDINCLENEIDCNTLFVSIIWVNNEIGTIQDLKKIDDICLSKGVILHSDATQAIGKININLNNYKALKLLTFTSHKIYGPKGIGSLIVRKTDGVKLKITPLLHGGSQEYGYRAGTLANELIVGFGKAVELITSNIDHNNYKISILEDKLISILKDKFNSNIIINNNFENRIKGIINIQFVGLNNMILLKKISTLVACSTGSACSIENPSHVLKAIGLNDKEISYSVRLSLSINQTVEELEILNEL